MRLGTLLTAAASAAALATCAHAATLTFDDLTPFVPIANGYGGLNWTVFDIEDAATAQPGSGYVNGVQSPSNLAFNRFAADATITDPNGTFTFNDAYFVGAVNDGLSLTITGKDKGSTLFTQTLTLDTTAATHFIANWAGVDELDFHSAGGTLHPGIIGAGAEFAMDNFTINASGGLRPPIDGGIPGVPEPQAWALMILGFGALGASLRARRSARLAEA